MQHDSIVISRSGGQGACARFGIASRYCRGLMWFSDSKSMATGRALDYSASARQIFSVSVVTASTLFA
jgi:hypothetical protein